MLLSLTTRLIRAFRSPAVANSETKSIDVVTTNKPVDVKSIEIKDIVITYGLSASEAIRMFQGYKPADPNKNIPVCCLREGQKIESFSDEELLRMGLKRAGVR